MKTKKPSRARYLAEWTNGKRAELIKAMGGRCLNCGNRTPADLEFHHPFGRPYNPSDWSRWRRIIQYRRDWENGLLELRCITCNRGHDGKGTRPQARRKTDILASVPF